MVRRSATLRHDDAAVRFAAARGGFGNLNNPEVTDAETMIVGTIQMLLARREDKPRDIPVQLDSDLQADLDLDSLELAEVSALLEDEFGRDPYSEGITPR